MNNDRELLELAARAAGIEYTYADDLGLRIGNGEYDYWSSLRNDGDALRLASSLHMQIDIREHSSEAHIRESNKWPFEFFSDHKGDKASATRHAITRAAAEIGKAMG